jgi:hypothetical protein
MFPLMFRRPPALRNARRTKRNPAVETLEGRQLMSLGPEFGINTTTRAAQIGSDNASSSNGTSVVVWTDYSNGDADIRAQRLNSQGGKLGAELIIAGKVGVNEFDPAVAMDAQGDFVVSWTQDHASGGTDVLAHKFNVTGVPVGGTVQVGVGTFAESESNVAMDARGDFVVSYTRNTNNNNPDVFAKRYDVNSQLLGVITVGGTSLAERQSSIAMSPDGRFDIAYQYQFSNTDYDVIASRYTAAGGLIEQSAIASSSALEEAPSIAMDNQGNAVIAYQKFVGSDWDIKARRFSGTGVLSGEINVQSTTANETSPSVALQGNAGAFVVAYDSGTGVNVSAVNSSNTVIATLSAGQTRYGPAISINAQNQFLVTYTADTSTDSNIVGRRGLL